MMVERHYDDESLIAMMEAERDIADDHLPSCTVCNAKLQSFRAISTTLRDKSLWDPAAPEVRSDPNPATIATLRAFADRMSAEDAAAAQILPELLAGPREEWMPRLHEHPEWRTAGVVRGLVGRTIAVMMTMPPDALEMTALSTEIADHLDPGATGVMTVARLRAATWRDRGYALYYVGQFADSLIACDHGARLLDGCVVDEYDRARLGIVRTLSLRGLEKFDEAAEIIRDSSEAFASYADITRYASARIVEVHLLFSHSEFAKALSILEPLERQLKETSAANIQARVLGNLGYCYWKLGRIDLALSHQEAAASLLDDLGERTEAVRSRWNTALVLASAGKTSEAVTRCEAIQRSFEELNMSSEAAVNGLEMAELLLVRGEYNSVEKLCRSAIAFFQRAGIPHGTRALTALAYIQEAAQQRTATPALVKHVREYIKRLPHDGELLFAPPPPPPETPSPNLR